MKRSTIKKAEVMVDKILENNSLVKKSERLVDMFLREQNEEISLDTFKDYFDDMRKKGFSDEKKLQGMLDRAKEIAKQQGKEGDRKVILGLIQGFFQEDYNY